MEQNAGMKIRCVGGPRGGYETTVPLGLLCLMLPDEQKPFHQLVKADVVIEPQRYHEYRARIFEGSFVNVDDVVLFDYC